MVSMQGCSKNAHHCCMLHALLFLLYIGCIISNKFTSVIQLDQYQANLQKESKEFQTAQHHKMKKEIKMYTIQKMKMELQHQCQSSQQQLLQETQQLLLSKESESQDSKQQFQEKVEVGQQREQLEKAKMSHFEEHNEFQKEPKGIKVKADTVSKKDDEIKLLKEMKEEKRLRQELQKTVESLKQQLHQFPIPQSGMCVY